MRWLRLVVGLFVVVWAPVVNAQQPITQTVTKDNKSCNGGCSVIDVPELNGNPSAIVFVTPSGSSAASNPHPIGAYFMYLKKWSVFNLDGAAITEGAIYSVEYYATPDADHFSFVVPTDGGSCIDRAGLNGNANAQLRLFPTSTPGGGALFNKDVVRAQYTPANGRWCLSISNGRPVPSGTAYNVAVGGARASAQQASTAAVPGAGAPQGTIILPPATLVPQLAPLTVIVRETWLVPTPAATLAPGKTDNYFIGYGDCRAMTSPFTNPAILAADTAIITGHAAEDGANQLTWTGAVENGAIRIFACNNLSVLGPGPGQTGQLAPQAVSLMGKTVNILVVR